MNLPATGEMPRITLCSIPAKGEPKLLWYGPSWSDAVTKAYKLALTDYSEFVVNDWKKETRIVIKKS